VQCKKARKKSGRKILADKKGGPTKGDASHCSRTDRKKAGKKKNERRTSDPSQRPIAPAKGKKIRRWAESIASLFIEGKNQSSGGGEGKQGENKDGR